jgi:hypothetical protein
LTQTIVAERLGKPPSEVAVIRRKYEGGDRRLDVLELIDGAAEGVVTCLIKNHVLQ